MTQRTWVRAALAGALLLAGTLGSVAPTFASNPNGTFQNQVDGLPQNPVNQNNNPQNHNKP